MANRCVELTDKGEAEVNTFLFSKSQCSEILKIKEFRSNNWEWAEFIMLNRDKSLIPPYAHGYDVVIGPVADSSVDSEIAEYRKEFGKAYRQPENLAILASRLKYSGERYTQYCFCTAEAIKYLIKD